MDAEPVKLMQLLQTFLFRHDLLNALDDAVYVAWTAAWRQESMFKGLMDYRLNYDWKIGKIE
ncbi:hypothetical protein CCR75_002561 [Bremia lactucae]|nr:hypothetical protein CCR75_002561 [Bremia lactucae]